MHPIFIQIIIFALSAAMGIIYVMQQVTSDSDSHVSSNSLRAILFIMLGILLLLYNRSKTISTTLSVENRKVSILPIFFASFIIVICASFFGMITCYSYYISGSNYYNMSLGFVGIATLLSIFFSGREEVFDWVGMALLVGIAVMIMVTGIYLKKASDDLDSEKSVNKGIKDFFKDMYIVAIVLSIFIIVGAIGIKVYTKFKESDHKSTPSSPDKASGKSPDKVSDESSGKSSGKASVNPSDKVSDNVSESSAYGGENNHEEWSN
jgi:hypothetical protein